MCLLIMCQTLCVQAFVNVVGMGNFLIFKMAFYKNVIFKKIEIVDSNPTGKNKQFF